MTNCECHGIGRIVGLRRCGKCKYSANHIDDLIFLGSAIADNGLLDLKRGIFKDLYSCPVRRKKYHSSCVSDRYAGRDISVEKKLLN